MDKQFFLAHACNPDHDVASTLAVALESLLVDAWVDEQRLYLAASLTREVEQGLARSDYCVVLLSRASLPRLRDRDAGFRQEVDRSLQLRATKKVQVVLVLLDSFSPRELNALPLLGDLLAKRELFYLDKSQSTNRDVAWYCDLAKELLRRTSMRGRLVAVPRLDAVKAGAYQLSRGQSFGGDTLRTTRAWNGYDQRDVDCLPYTVVGGGRRAEPRPPAGAIVVEFAHLSAPDAWWAAEIGFRTGEEGEWLPIDLTSYARIEFELRVSHAHRYSSIWLRLEDDSAQGSSGSGRASTERFQCQGLRPHYDWYGIDLDGLDWSRGAYPLNAQACDRSRVLHITLGNDPGDSAASSNLMLRRIRLILGS